jgi:FkbM family methyltransferase
MPARSDAEYDYNFMGARVAHEFERDLIESNPAFPADVAMGLKASGRSAVYEGEDSSYPFRKSEDYLEWVDLLVAIDRADTRFSMIEVGAGYGRWIVNAAAALKRRKAKTIATIKLVGLEADIKRFAMMEKNCADNGIPAEDLQLIRAACMPDEAPGFMMVNDGYGNHVWRDERIASQFATNNAETLPFTDDKGSRYFIEKVPAIRLASLLTDQVDFIDMDIQGGEFDVIASCVGELNKFVKMIHIGTHSVAIDARLCYLFHLHGWRPRRILTCGQVNQTPYGEFQFIDGIQSWENPRFDV